MPQDMRNRVYNIASICCIVSFSFIMLLLVCLKTPTAIGEADDYALETMAIQMTGNIEITEAIVEQAKRDFPDFASRFDASWSGVYAGTTDLYRAYNGKIYPWYGAAYSCTCIIMKVILENLHLNQTYAFCVTNVCLYTISLLYVFFCLNTNRKNIFLLVLLLICSPSVVYCLWSSAEVFIFTFIVLSLTNFVNKNYKRAAFYVSIAGSMNTTVMILGVIIIIDYFIEFLKGTANIKEGIIKLTKNTKYIILFGACFLPSLTTYVYNLIYMHKLELQTTLGLAKTDYWFERITAYFFDLNMGYIVYYFIVFVLWLVLFIKSIIKPKRQFLMLSIAFIGVVCAYSLTFHINCGMMGIARYGAWAASIFLFAVVTQYENIFCSQIIKKIFSVTIMLSAAVTVTILIWFSSYNYLSHLQYSPLAAMVLNNCPKLYNPYPYTFISRTQQIDGGYWGTEDRSALYYEDTEGYIRKILIVNETKEYLLNHLLGSPNDVAVVQKRLSNADYFEYVNIEKGIDVFIDKNYPCVFYPAEDDTLASKSWGVYERENDKHWFSNDVTIILNGTQIKDRGIEVEYYIAQEMVDKYVGKAPVGDIYCNGNLIGNVDLSTGGYNLLTIGKDILPECELGYYRIQIKSDYFFTPATDMPGKSNDMRRLCMYVSYIGAPRKH